jgi:hypothetical protein
MYSRLPIADSTALAVVSYDGNLRRGFTKYELLPDPAPDVFADAVEKSFAELAAAAGVPLAVTTGA